MWVGELPNEQTPPGATRAFNSVRMLRGAQVVGIGIAEDNDNAGEYLTCLMFATPEGKVYQMSVWTDEQMSRVGHIEVSPLTDS